MYKTTVIFSAVLLLETIAEEVLFVGILGRAEVPRALDQLVTLVIAATCGVFGNFWYLSHARKVISRVLAEGLDEQATLEKLSKLGGTSLGGALICLLLIILALFVVFVALDFLVYS